MKKIMFVLAILSALMSGCCGACLVAGGASIAGAYAVKKQADNLKASVDKGPDPRAVEWAEKSYKSVRERKWDEAIKTASKAIRLDSGLVNPYINRAWAYCERGFYNKAIDDCNTALQMNPGNAPAYNNRGLAYDKKEDKERAKADYEKACKLGLEVACKNYEEITGYPCPWMPAQVAKLIRQSQERFEQRDWDEVIQLTSEAVELDSENELAYLIRAGAYVRKGLGEEALDDYNTAIELNPDFGLAYNNRGYALELLGRAKEAALDYEMGCRLGLNLGCQNRKRLCKCNCCG